MKNLRKQFNRFCLQNRNKGIPNLMLYVVLGSAIVSIMSMFNGGNFLYRLLCFDKALILKGQVWRLFTFVFTENSGGFLGLIFLYFFYGLGRAVEQSMGTFRFNLYYFSGVLLMDVFAMIFCPTEAVIIQNEVFTTEIFVLIYSQMAFFLHLSLLLTFAVTNPNAQFIVLFIIPVKARFMCLVYLIILFAEIFNMTYPINLFPHNLFPLVGVANFLLFSGGDLSNILPLSFQRKAKQKTARKTGTIYFEPDIPPYGSVPQKSAAPYNHRCTVCGRTDATNPELEFRYCSRCQGYHCYCEEHISNHIHIE